ncbi:DMT family transporter [Saezia sanguinis]|uniref:DMT family transporter n=1 Tax=Saezia sanguinis TaxID=1965230 RepID=UPI003063CBF1
MNHNNPDADKHFDYVGLMILVLPPLFWAGNFVVARAVRESMPPVSLAFGRWVIALVFLLPFAWKAMRKDMPLYWQYRWRVLGVALAGVTAFNSLVYAGLQTTTATNGILLNSFIPILIVFFGALFYGHRLRVIQLCGLLLSFTGVLIIIVHGRWDNLLSLSFSRGDLIIFSAMVCWAFYTLWLRVIPPQVDRVGLTAIQIVIAVVVLLPFFLWEWSTGARPHWNMGSIAALAYVGIFPSVLAYVLYNIGVARVGAARAGVFIHLMPVFGALLSVLFLHEQLHLYHLIGIGAIFMGIGLSGRQK